MTNTSGVQDRSANRRNKFIAYLLLTAALVSSAKDLSRVKDLAAWMHAGLAPVFATNLPADRSCPRTRTPTAEAIYGVRHIAFDQSGRVNPENEPQVGGEIAMADFGKTNHSIIGAAPYRNGGLRTNANHLDQQAVEKAIALTLANSARAMEFKALSRSFTFDVPPPAALSKDDGETPDADALPDIPAAPLSRPARRHVVNADRELNLKIQNAIIRLRRAS